ncbi:hypothetical protein LV475_05875 [Guyparkeria hydrothermalis]|uniref:hypothetical protein n=2 Tax=Guyparkeria TaxID=2035712 RepID=UPI00202021EB|nr:hypothetical protein [Guyparkeria hydrothermalis]MCL7751120.1 hypothetical protein [Guyparkeria hydrothermalis]
MQDKEPTMTPLTQLARPLAVALLAIAGILAAGPTLAQSDGESASVHGLTQEQVIARFGEPERRHAPVPATGEHPTPPITRWDYADFSIFFEKRIALHRVEHGKFPPQ